MWNERYNIEPYFYGKMPNDFLVSESNRIPKGNVLCLADGEGRNSVFLARSGYQVTGVDSSQTGIDKAQKLAQEAGVEVDYQCADLADFPINPSSWDGVVSVFCHLPSKLRQNIFRSVVNGLKPGGTLILESYAPNQLQYGTGGPKNLDLLADLESLKSDLSGLDWIVSHEIERIVMEGMGHSGPSAVIQLIGVKAS